MKLKLKMKNRFSKDIRFLSKPISYGTMTVVFILFLSFFTEVNAANKTFYVDVNATTSGIGTSASPFNTLADAVWTANQNTIDNIILSVQGTLSASAYLEFSARSTWIVITSYGTGFTVSGAGTAANYAGGYLMAIVGSGNLIKVQNVKFVSSNSAAAGNYGLFFNGSTRGGTLNVTGCTFNNLSWTANSSQDDNPQTSSDYIHPLIYDFGTRTPSVNISNNTFSNVALGYGSLVYNNSANGSHYATDAAAVADGNTLTNVVKPWTAVNATEFYVDASVPAGTAWDGSIGSGGIGSKNDPFKYLNSSTFGAIFYDYSTSPATYVDKDVTIYFMQGTHALRETMYIEGVQAGSSLKLMPFPGASVTLDGGGLTDQWASLMAFKDCHNVTINGFKLTNLTTSQAYSIDARFGIIFRGAGSNITISNNEITDMHWSNNAYDKLHPLPTNNLGPIQVLGTENTSITNVKITGNHIYNITPGYTEAITVNGNVNGFEITNNLVHDIANIGIVAAGNYAWVSDDNPVSAANNYARNGTISGNKVYRCISPIAVSAGLYLDGSRYVTVENNESYQNGAGISIGNEQYNSRSGNHTIQGNKFYNNLDAGMYIGTTNQTSMVEDVVVTGNEISNNFNQTASLVTLANGLYGGMGIGYEVKTYLVENLTFTGNTITAGADYIMSREFYDLQTGHDYDNNSYGTLTNTTSQYNFSYTAYSGGNLANGTTNTYTLAQHQSASLLDASSTLGGLASDPIVIIGGAIDYSHLYPSSPTIVAHRGLWKEKGFPENSKAAIAAANNSGKVDWIEVDIKMAGSEHSSITQRRAIVMHDHQPQRLFGFSGPENTYIYNYGYTTLTSQNLYDRFGNVDDENPMTLAQLMQYVASQGASHKPVNLDIGAPSIGTTAEIALAYKEMFLEAIDLIFLHELNDQIILKWNYTYDDPVWEEVAQIVQSYPFNTKNYIFYIPKFGTETTDVTNYYSNWETLHDNRYVGDPVVTGKNYSTHPAQVVGMEIRIKGDDANYFNLKNILTTAKTAGIKVGIFSEGSSACEGLWNSNARKAYHPYTEDQRTNVEWVNSLGYDLVITDFPEHMYDYKNRTSGTISSYSSPDQESYPMVTATNGGFSIGPFVAKKGQLVSKVLAQVSTTFGGTVMMEFGVNENGDFYTTRSMGSAYGGGNWDLSFWEPRNAPYSDLGANEYIYFELVVEKNTTRLHIGTPNGKFDCSYLDYGTEHTIMEGAFTVNSPISTMLDIYPEGDLVAYPGSSQPALCRTDSFYNARHHYFGNSLYSSLNLSNAANSFQYLDDDNPYYSGSDTGNQAVNEAVYADENADLGGCTYSRSSFSSAKESTNEDVKTVYTQSIDKEALIYPNPSQGIINIQLGEQFTNDEELIVSLYDLYGQLEQSTEIQIPKETSNISWNTYETGNKVSNGVYILKVIGKSYQLNKRIVMDCGCRK